MNGDTTADTNGKAPLTDRIIEPIVKVQPPRREDLQPSYAQVIKPDTEDAAQHGWYGMLHIRTSILIHAVLTPHRRHD